MRGLGAAYRLLDLGTCSTHPIACDARAGMDIAPEYVIVRTDPCPWPFLYMHRQIPYTLSMHPRAQTEAAAPAPAVQLLSSHLTASSICPFYEYTTQYKLSCTISHASAVPIYEQSMYLCYLWTRENRREADHEHRDVVGITPAAGHQSLHSHRLSSQNRHDETSGASSSKQALQSTRYQLCIAQSPYSLRRPRCGGYCLRKWLSGMNNHADAGCCSLGLKMHVKWSIDDHDHGEKWE